MKKADVKVGEFYAYQQSSYSRPERVRIKGTAMIKPRYSGYGSKSTSGWLIEKRDGTVVTDRGQTIIRPWAEQVALDNQKRAAADVAKNNRHEARERRAASAAGLANLYRALGLKDDWVRLFPKHDSRDVLNEHLIALGYETELKEARYGDDYLMVKVPSDNVLLYLIYGTGPRIPEHLVPALVEAAEVFL